MIKMRRDKLIKAAGRPPFSVALDPIPDRPEEIRVYHQRYILGIWSSIQGDWIARQGFASGDVGSCAIAEAVASWLLGDVEVPQ